MASAVLPVRICLGFFVFLILAQLADAVSRPTDIKPAEIGNIYTGSIDKNIEEVYAFNYTSTPGKVDALRVSVRSNSDDLEFPVLFVVRQQKGVLSWQVPLVFRGYNQRTYTYQDVGRTLCPIDPESQTPTSQQLLYIDIASMAPTSVQYELVVRRLANFELQTDVPQNFSASPSQPQYFLYSFPEGVDSVIIKVKSAETYPCTVVSVQDIKCPVYDLDHNVEFNGIYQSMTKKAAITIQRKDFPTGQFYTVFVIKPEDYTCGGSVPVSTIGIGNHTWNLKRVKYMEVTIKPAINESVYIHATLLCLLFFLIFYLGAFVVLLIHHLRMQKKGLNINGSPEEGEGTVAASHPITTSTPEGSSYGAIDESRQRKGKSVPPIPRPRVYSDSSVDEESDFDGIPEMEGDKNVIQAKTLLYVSDLSIKDRRTISKKYRIYFWNIVTIAVFYALPVVQLVITYQTVVNVTGNQDICYYNFLCAHPLGVLSAFNNILSNLGHVLLGFLFLLIVLYRDLQHHSLVEVNDIYALEFGIPKHFGLFYTMGIALTTEGILSACYHVCPNYSNFQFDTSFMYMIAGLCMLKLYQTRHPDINASAYAAYASFALVIFLAVLGVVFGKDNWWFWVIFSIIHVVGSLALSTHIYYMGRFRIDFGIFRRIFQIVYTDCMQQCSRPMYMDRMILLIVGNIVNWFFAIFGLVYRPRDFASYLLGIFICNLLLYLAFYIIMKLRSSERIRLLPLLCILATAGVWAAALYFFFQTLSSWEESPAQSREKNRECILMHFFDDHDIWHFLSATAMFFSFLVLLTLDDDLDDVRRDKIPVF
ncbi:SID1 transmembrane family member 1 [Bufo bufo]|uniref:SID1 transmembrane family member 1 n=1 Tax=Bufo bufo TaxID=8384 RepID=UPI001ABE5558|nr:SID1 transmembrane family member 1 [Bufo bufo]